MTTRHHFTNSLTLVELILTVAILGILASAAVPFMVISIRRERERGLRRDLWEIRDAIDRYKDAADRGQFQTKLGSQGYPPDLNTLVDGIDVRGKRVRFLRRIPVDPVTGKSEWGQPTSNAGRLRLDILRRSERF